MAAGKFHHEEIYRGKDAIKKLGTKKLVICGVGAIGSNLVDTLVRQGFSDIRIIDKDRVDTHNLNTQTFDEADIGATKVQAVQMKAVRSVGVEPEVEFKELTAANAKKLLKGADLIVDAFDNHKSRLLLQEYVREHKVPCLHAGMDTEYAEVVWDQVYKVPNNGLEDICDYPLSRNIVAFTVAIASEEIVDFVLASKPRQKSWCITLKDLRISQYNR